MARPLTSIDQPRYAKWVRASNGLKIIAPGLPVFVQGLGKLDAQLVHQDAVFLSLPEQQRQSFDESIKPTDRITMSRLWVFGAYEAVRTLSQRVRKNPRLVTKRLAARVSRMKKQFERVRIPLAKLEPASAHASTDFGEAVPALDRQVGVSWKVAKRVVVPRQRLSERFLNLLQAISKSD